jgi:hypothetical protein
LAAPGRETTHGQKRAHERENKSSVAVTRGMIMLVMLLTAKSKSSIELGRWNIVVLTAAGFWVLYFVLSSWRLLSDLIGYFRFGSPAGAERIPTAELIALYLHHLPWWLALAAWSLVTGACLALGVKRYPVGRAAGILAFFSGTFMSIIVIDTAQTFRFYALETSLLQWFLFGVCSMGVPWLLGRVISRVWP